MLGDQIGDQLGTVELHARVEVAELNITDHSPSPFVHHPDGPLQGGYFIEVDNKRINANILKLELNGLCLVGIVVQDRNDPEIDA
ncbi:MAG TPA: hypothetical protein VLK56_02290 [Solirubrobacterales bacterium]|nr:hypothetical protein [Solirubrobacterales bacterium]